METQNLENKVDGNEAPRNHMVIPTITNLIVEYKVRSRIYKKKKEIYGNVFKDYGKSTPKNKLTRNMLTVEAGQKVLNYVDKLERRAGLISEEYRPYFFGTLCNTWFFYYNNWSFQGAKAYVKSKMNNEREGSALLSPSAFTVKSSSSSERGSYHSTRGYMSRGNISLRGA